MHIAGWQKVSLVDYPGKVACTLFTGGCNFRCPYCHNSELLEGEMPSQDMEEVMAYLDARKGILDGVVISGGEPCLQSDLVPFLARLKEKGLDAYEYQCGKGVTVGEATARAIGENARAAGIILSLHAPYFVNPANPDPDSQEKTAGYVLAACRVAKWMGAGRVVIHTGALQKRTRREALTTAKESFVRLRRRCDDAGYSDLLLCPETMGKINQLGDLEEVLELCTAADGLLPCVDFGHLYARSLGALEGEEATEAMLDRMEAVLGTEWAARFHSHFSKIAFTPKGGESRHLTFDQADFGPDPAPLCRAIARRGWTPTVICESAGTQDLDAAVMKDLYQGFLPASFR